jgi:hypothetical protein
VANSCCRLDPAANSTRLAPFLGFRVASGRALPRTGGKLAATLQPATIIGANGRIGNLFKSLGGDDDVLVSRGDPIPADGEGPVFVCTRNDVLEGLVAGCPATRRPDLVFMQNGYLDRFLVDNVLASNTQALIFFAVSKKGEPPIDGKTDFNPDGLTKVTGPWAAAFAARCEAAGLSCDVVSAEEYKVAMFEKLIWICSFMLVGALHGGVTVGEVEAQHKDQVSVLILELARAVEATQKGVKFGPRVPERLCAYARSVAHFPTAIKEFEWRNGFFWDLSEAAEDDGDKPDPCPLHTRYCNQGLLEDCFDF